MTEMTERSYSAFVQKITSNPSKNEQDFLDRLTDLCYASDNKRFPQLLTGAIGLADEAGEVLGLLKKVMFQGKKLDEETLAHLKKEVGDVRFYLEELYLALEMTDTDSRHINYDKLTARAGGESFSVDAWENREEGDV